jgi:single-stranded DNA-binding protein
MYTMNQITIIGFTGSDAEAHYTPNGTLVVTLSVATKESWKGAPTATGRAEQTGIELFLSGSRRNSLGH